MHYLFEKAKKGFRNVFTIIAARSQNKTEKKKVLVHVLRLLSACARLARTIFVSLFGFSGLLSIFSLRQTRVVDELARASSALRMVSARKGSRKKKWKENSVSWVGGSYKSRQNFAPWYHFETCSRARRLWSFCVKYFRCESFSRKFLLCEVKNSD